MLYGAKNIMWAPFAEKNPEPAGALPKYGTPFNLGELNKVADNPNFSVAKASADNTTKRYKSKFVDAAVDVDILDMTNEHAAAVMGSKIPDSAEKNLHFNANDKPPYGGLGFHVNELLDENVDAYKGVFYPKVKATMQGTEYNTAGETITLTGKKLHFLALACGNGDWKIESDYFGSEEEAVAWVNNMLKADAAAASTNTEGTATA